MSYCKNIIITLLIIILISVIGYAVWNMWNKEVETEEVIVFETYQDTVKLDCSVLRDNLRKIFSDKTGYLREYILANLNNHSYDEKYFLYLRLIRNMKEVSEQIKYILGDKVASELNSLLVEYVNNWKRYLDNFNEEEKRPESDFLSMINASTVNIGNYLSKNLYIQDEKKPYTLFQNNFVEKMKMGNGLTLEELKNYRQMIFPISIEFHDKNINYNLELADELATLLCKKSQENKKKE